MSEKLRGGDRVDRYRGNVRVIDASPRDERARLARGGKVRLFQDGKRDGKSSSSMGVRMQLLGDKETSCVYGLMQGYGLSL